jgi:hypothetical protein
VAVGISREHPAQGAAGFDFVFSRGDTAEIIRVGVDGDHRVVSAELLRTAGSLLRGAQCLEAEGLLQALRAGEAVAELRWGRSAWSPDSLQILMRKDSRVTVPLI